jgi:hypothetical protein
VVWQLIHNVFFSCFITAAFNGRIALAFSVEGYSEMHISEWKQHASSYSYSCQLNVGVFDRKMINSNFRAIDRILEFM